MNVVLFCGIVIMAALPSYAQIFSLPAPDTTIGNYFGTSVAIDGNVTVIGATGERSCGPNSGAAYIYEMDETGAWIETTRLTPVDCREEIFFGTTVAVSGDRILIAAYVPFFSRQTSNAVYVYERHPETGKWQLSDLILQPAGAKEGPFASSIALDGDRVLITTSGDTTTGEYGGVAYIYDLIDDKWVLSAELTGSLGTEAGIFGTSSALDGDRAIVSASTYLAGRAGSVYVYDRNPVSGEWTERSVLLGILDFFISVDVSGDRILVGESKGGKGGRGRARIFEPSDDGKWRPAASLIPKSDKSQGGFGSLVSLSGNRALVVGFDEQLSQKNNIDRVVYLFKYDEDADEWSQKHIIDIGDNAFGSALDLTIGSAVIGQASDQKIGRAYIVRIR